MDMFPCTLCTCSKKYTKYTKLTPSKTMYQNKNRGGICTKINITFAPGEDAKAEAVLETIRAELGESARVKRTPQRDGFLHTYITTPLPGKP